MLKAFCCTGLLQTAVEGFREGFRKGFHKRADTYNLRHAHRRRPRIGF